MAVPSWYLVPALLCGNAVVWKPAEYTPAIARAFTELFVAGGLPAGVLNTVLADGPATYDGLSTALDDGLVQKIGFTGSSAVGVRIGELAGRHLQTPCLELGGKNPLVVMPDADLDLAVEGALFSGFGTAGQRCTSLGTVIVHESVHDAFLARFDAAVRAAAIGDPTDDVLYGPMISARFLENFEKHLALVEPHHTLHGSTGTGRITADNPRDGFVGDLAGLYAHPTIVDGVRREDALYRTETFGPIVGVATFSTFDEAVELANGHGYGLSAAIYTTDPAHAFRFRERVSAGMVSVNNSTSGAEAHLPFGGNGRSGNGSRQSGVWVLDQFTRWQSLNWDYAGQLQKAQMDTPDLPGGPGLPPGLTGPGHRPFPGRAAARGASPQPPSARDNVAASTLGRPVRRSSVVGERHQPQARVDEQPAQRLGLPAPRPVPHPGQPGDRVVAAEHERGERAPGQVRRADAVADVAARPADAVGAEPDARVPVARDAQRAAPRVA